MICSGYISYPQSQACIYLVSCGEISALIGIKMADRHGFSIKGIPFKSMGQIMLSYLYDMMFPIKVPAIDQLPLNSSSHIKKRMKLFVVIYRYCREDFKFEIPGNPCIVTIHHGRPHANPYSVRPIILSR